MTPGRPGDRSYRGWVGNPEKYDVMAASQFSLLTQLGLREHHRLLDVGCGSLRGGRLFIPYLLPDRYFGIEPERWLVEEGIRNELGEDLVRLKRPSFSHVDDFTLSVFGAEFDFVLAQSIFSHAARPQVERCLQEARKVIRSGGVMVATFLEGEEDYPGDAWVYPECVTYRAATMAAMTEAAGLRWSGLDWPHLTGQQWVAITPVEDDGRASPGGYRGLRDELIRCQQTLARIGRHPAVRAYAGSKRLLRRLTGRSR